MSDSLKRASDAYFHALAVIDPLRLRFWDSRGATTTQLRVMYEIRKQCNPSTRLDLTGDTRSPFAVGRQRTRADLERIARR
jgi:hypothetical protein